ncbi:MAG: hypothetical protein AAFN77_05660 [Planctomycetota bacterium]
MRWLVLPLIACLISVQPPDGLFAQESDSDDPLPTHAVWRNGEFGKTNRFAGIYRLTFSPDGKLLATRNQEMEIHIIDVATNQTLCEIEGHEQLIQSVEFSPDSQLLITAAGANEKVKIWNAKTGKLKSTIDTIALAAYFNDSGTQINVLGVSEVETYSWPGATLIRKKKWKNQKERAVGMSNDGRLVVMYRSFRNIYQTLVMDLESRSKVQLSAPTLKPRGMTISPDRNWVAMSFERDPKVRIWDLRDPHSRTYVLNGHDATVQTLAFSPDNRFLLTGGWDDTNILWDVISQKQIQRNAGHTENVNAAAMAPFDFRFATGASGRTDNSVLLWDYRHRVLLSVDQPQDDFDEVWKDLGHQEYNLAMTEANRIIQAPDRWLPNVTAVIEKETNNNTTGTVEELIKLLDSPKFAIREQAVLQLIKIRVQADSQIRAAMENATSPEVRYRLNRVLKQKIVRPARDVVVERRWSRLIFALEQINSSESQALLKRIADGHSNIDFARTAFESYERNRVRNE